MGRLGNESESKSIERKVGCTEHSFKTKGSYSNMDSLDDWLYEVYVSSKGYSK